MQGAKYEDEKQQRAFLEHVERRVSELPGVQQAALSWSQPVWGFSSSSPFIVEGQPEPDPSNVPEVFRETVSEHYFETLGVRLIEGRNFNADDAVGQKSVIIINQTMARRFWPNESAIGKRIGNTSPDHNWKEVIGVVNDIEFPGTLEEPYTRWQSFYYMPRVPFTGGLFIHLRGSLPPESFANDLRAAVGQIDSDLPVYEIRTTRSLVDEALGNVSLLGALLGAIAALGITLAVIGIYGVTSYSVAERTAEFGLRMALGAQRVDVVKMVLGKGARLVLAGAAVGLVGSYGVAKLLEAAIPLLPTRDPLTLAVICIVLVATALVGCYLPSRRAARVDPMVALRCE
jgi:predicted permease